MPLLDWLNKSHAIKTAARVRLCRDVESEGYRLRRDRAGTVLSVYGDGAAYAVEFADVNGEIVVVTVVAEALVAEAGRCATP